MAGSHQGGGQDDRDTGANRGGQGSKDSDR
jgi:hypothetical protein